MMGLWLAGWVACSGAEDSQQDHYILDMVHHNPGEKLYETAYEKPEVIKKMGFNGKVYYLFDSPTLAINWESVDPEIFPVGSAERAWVDAKAKRIKQQHASCRAAGIQTMAMADLVLFPKKLINKYGLEKIYGDPSHPQTQKYLRAQIGEMFDQFPDLDGIVVRIGETYLHDAPYHRGHIRNKTSPEKTIIPLMQLLREEVCVKRSKDLVFRTWMSFDKNLAAYKRVSQGVEPHAKLVIAIKHCEGDFHRANPFSKVIGEGRHKQLIEVQCAREYEGKGAYPNYIAHGVIEGFEEYQDMPAGKMRSIRELVETKPDLFAGIWTWTRGGGWNGPYITNEMWCDVNAWVMAQWAADPSKSEEFLLARYAKERLQLKGVDITKFRKLCLLSADAVLRGRNSIQGDMNPWWTRDQGIGYPPAHKDAEKQQRNLKQKDEAIRKWKEVVSLAEGIQWADEETREFAVSSSYYGLYLYEIYRALVYLSDAEARKDIAGVKQWIGQYDAAWARYQALPEKYNKLSTLYTKEFKRHIRNHADTKVNSLR